MSLIQEALRRQQEEESGAEAGAGTGPGGPEIDRPQAPGEPARPVQTASPPEETEAVSEDAAVEDPKKSAGPKTWTVLLGVIFLILVVIGVAVYLVTTFMSRISGDKLVETEMEVARVKQVQPPPAVSAPVEVEPRPAPEPEQVSKAPAAEAVEPDPVVQREPPRDAVESAEPDTVVAPSVRGDDIRSRSERPEPVAPERRPSVEWPRLRLTAVLAGLGEGENAARINGRMISEGGRIEGVTLKNVRHDGVLLELHGQTRDLKVGGILE